MAEYIDKAVLLEAFENADADVLEAYDYYSTWGYSTKIIESTINSVPSIDAVPVVRCKDCKWNKPDKLLDKHWCTRICGCIEVRYDDYCSYGRKENE